MKVCRTVSGLPLLTLPSTCLCLFTGKPRVELTYDKMYTVTSRLTFTVSREDDGVPVICIVDHPAVKDFQAQKYLEVQCEYLRSHILMLQNPQRNQRWSQKPAEMRLHF